MFVAENTRKGVKAHLGGILDAMLEAYANGDSEAVIFVHSGRAITLVNEWTEKWKNQANRARQEVEGNNFTIKKAKTFH